MTDPDVASARRDPRRTVFATPNAPADPPPLRKRGGLLLCLALLAASCAEAPLESLQRDARANRLAGGLRCESIVASQEIQMPLTGNLGDVRVTLREVPETIGALRVLVRHPRFAAGLELEGAPRPFDRVLSLSPERDLTVVLTRPPGADDDWPRDTCKACRIEVELTGLFGAREGLRTFFSRALQDAAAVEGAFSRQSGEPVRGTELRELAESMQGEATRCGVTLRLDPVVAALDQLDAARLHFYAGPSPELPDPMPAVRAFEAVQTAFETQPLVAEVARDAGWPQTVRHTSTRLHWSHAHLELAAQAALLPAVDRAIAAPWIAFALAPDNAALDRRAGALPRLRDLADAEARVAWVDARPGPLPLPGAARPAFLRVRELRAVRHGKPCIGPGGAVPAREGDALTVAQLLGADAAGQFPIARTDDIPAARETLRKAGEILCEAPEPDVTPLFAQLADKELGPVAARLSLLLREARAEPNDAIARGVREHTERLLCALFDPRTVARRASTVAGYKVFVEGGTEILNLAPDPLVCEGRALTAAEIRRRLREAYREALDRHATTDRLCPSRGGKCPEEVAGSVRRLFSLPPPDLAAPAAEQGRALDFPPPFGFSDAWVHRLGRCAREACSELQALRSSAPQGQFQGEVCASIPGADAQQTVSIEGPEAPATLTLSCEGTARVAVQRKRSAGTLVTIASPHPFRFGSQSVSRQGKSPQLGRIYERVLDLNDPKEATPLPDGSAQVSITPSTEGQVFYFTSLRGRD
jgi:hypothetical protein